MPGKSLDDQPGAHDDIDPEVDWWISVSKDVLKKLASLGVTAHPEFPTAGSDRSLRIPESLRHDVEQISKLTDPFCAALPDVPERPHSEGKNRGFRG